MEKKRPELLLAVVLLLAADILLLMSKYMKRAEGLYVVMLILENLVLLGILGVAVRGVKGMGWRPWLWTAAVSSAGTVAGLAIWNVLMGMIPGDWLRSIGASLIIAAGQLILGILMITGMGLLLHRIILRDRRMGLRTFGRLELILCPVFLAALFGATMLAEWYERASFLYAVQHSMLGNPMDLFTAMTGMGSSRVRIVAAAVYQGGRLLLRAFCIWIMVCGVLGFADQDKTETGRVV